MPNDVDIVIRSVNHNRIPPTSMACCNVVFPCHWFKLDAVRECSWTHMLQSLAKLGEIIPSIQKIKTRSHAKYTNRAHLWPPRTARQVHCSPSSWLDLPQTLTVASPDPLTIDSPRPCEVTPPPLSGRKESIVDSAPTVPLWPSRTASQLPVSVIQTLEGSGQGAAPEHNPLALRV